MISLVDTSRSTRQRWAEWLRVPLEHAAAQGNHGLVDNLLGAGANASVSGGRAVMGAFFSMLAQLGESEGEVVLAPSWRSSTGCERAVPCSVHPVAAVSIRLYQAATRLRQGVLFWLAQMSNLMTPATSVCSTKRSSQRFYSLGITGVLVCRCFRRF